MATRRFTSSDGCPIWSVEYADSKGMTILLDREPIRQRFTGEIFAYDVETLVELMNDGRLVAFGTHEGDENSQLLLKIGGEFTEDERSTHGAHHELDGGVLSLSSSLVVTDWAGFSQGCNEAEGEIPGAPIEVEAGDYRVTIYRQFGPDEDGPDAPTVHLVCLVPDGADESPSFDAIPGNDGYF